MKKIFKQISAIVFILVSSQSISAQEAVKPVKKTTASTETINCVKCPVKKDTKGNVLDRIIDPKKKDTLKKAKSN